MVPPGPGPVGPGPRLVTPPSFTDEQDHLAAHPELLEPAADDAVEEVLLAVSAAEADRYRRLRDTAGRDGITAAYRLLLLTELAHQFVAADPPVQRELLVKRREDLLDDRVAQALANSASQDEQSARAGAGAAGAGRRPRRDRGPRRVSSTL